MRITHGFKTLNSVLTKPKVNCSELYYLEHQLQILEAVMTRNIRVLMQRRLLDSVHAVKLTALMDVPDNLHSGHSGGLKLSSCQVVVST